MHSEQYSRRWTPITPSRPPSHPSYSYYLSFSARNLHLNAYSLNLNDLFCRLGMFDIKTALTFTEKDIKVIDVKCWINIFVMSTSIGEVCWWESCWWAWAPKLRSGFRNDGTVCALNLNHWFHSPNEYIYILWFTSTSSSLVRFHRSDLSLEDNFFYSRTSGLWCASARTTKEWFKSFLLYAKKSFGAPCEFTGCGMPQNRKTKFSACE